MGFRSAVPLDVHVIRIANRDYALGAAEKGLTKDSYQRVADQLRKTWGADAGWVQAVLFYNEVANRPKTKSPKEKKKRKKT